MSDEQENKMQQQIRGMQANIQAHKQIISDFTEAALVNKTNFLLYQQSHKEIADALAQAHAKIKVLEDELNSLKTPIHQEPEQVA